MLLAIASNPTTENQQELWDLLKLKDEKEKDDEFDAVGFELLKQKMAGGKAFVVKSN
jgi:hypothetical protein